MSSLDTIAKKYGTDKSSQCHNYCDKYERYLPFKTSDNLNILEIGVFHGKSLLTWKEYFYNATLVGLDIEPTYKQFEDIGNNIHIEIGSQSDKAFLNAVVSKHGSFNMIFDDGSRKSKDVIASFEYLFDFVKSGGMYIVEDSCTSYWEEFNVADIGWEMGGKLTMSYFKNLTDDINFRGLKNGNGGLDYARREDWLTPQSMSKQPDCRTDIESITFLNSIILIRKR